MSWSLVVASIFLTRQESITIDLRLPLFGIDVPLPVSEDVWSTSESVWSSRSLEALRTPSFSTSLLALLDGNRDTVIISPFGLLTLVAALQCHICSSENVLSNLPVESTKSTVKCLDSSLKAWERHWKSHPFSTYQLKSKYGPIMADCLAILTVAHYHLHASHQLRWMRMMTQNDPPDVSTLKRAFLMTQPSATEEVLIRAVNAIRMRARYGLRYLNRTGGLVSALYQMIAGFESCKSFHSYY
jgi:hypothetical protein